MTKLCLHVLSLDNTQLYEASLEKPDLLIDAATLTGAARIALGPDLPAVFTNCDEAWSQLSAAGDAQVSGKLPHQWLHFFALCTMVFSS